ncbi:hypothetical protein MMC22_005266 [Lobaria immixta]|nr:hypothetical protein [Lobaria immixta]
MAKPAATKRPSKPSSKTPLKSSPNHTTSKFDPKYPFQPPSSSLVPFLATLPPTHIYLIHTDTFPPSHKRRIFAVPLLLNICISLLLLWRAYYAIPSYFAILLATLGFDNRAYVDINATDWPALVEIGASRTGMFFLDFALVRFVAVWPFDFFWGTPAGPMRWRWEVGFGKNEVVVRRSRRWGEGVVGEDQEVLGEGKIGSRAFEERVIPGMDAAWVRGRSGMAMLDKNWDLWFRAMVDAHALVDKGKMRMEDFGGRMVAVHTEEKGWLVWQVEENEKGGPARRKIQLVKARLEGLGKESLFWSWVELVQFETDQAKQGDNGTGSAREDVMKRGKQLFEAHGVDFDDFWRTVGGMDDMPGMAA